VQSLARRAASLIRGRLTRRWHSANGNYDLQFALFDAADGNKPDRSDEDRGPAFRSAPAFSPWTLDFGASAFSGANRFLEISAQTQRRRSVYFADAGDSRLLRARMPCEV
jgi:hypothetical protein